MDNIMVRCFSALFTLSLCFGLTPSFLNEPEVEVEDSKVLFCYLPTTRASSHYFRVDCLFASAEGEDGEVLGEATTSCGAFEEPNDDFEGRLWRFTLPSKAYVAAFQITYLESDDVWGTTSYSKIDSSVFIYDTQNFANLTGQSGWGSASLESKYFVNWILGNLDPNSSSPINGYNAYPQIESGFFRHLSDGKEEHLKSLKWEDEYLGPTNALEKWDLVRQNYQSHKKKSVPWAWYLGGASLLLVSGGLLAYPFLSRLKRRKKE